MKRLIFLAVMALFTLSLSACGNNNEKKVETQAQQEIDQSKIKLENANKDLKGELSDGAAKTNPTSKDDTGVGIVTPNTTSSDTKSAK